MMSDFHSGPPMRKVVYAWEGEVEALHARIRELEAEIRDDNAWCKGYDQARSETIERVLAIIPGGNICDPQEIADRIRALKPTVTLASADCPESQKSE